MLLRNKFYTCVQYSTERPGTWLDRGALSIPSTLTRSMSLVYHD